MIAEDKGLPSYVENDLHQQIKQQIEEFNTGIINKMEEDYLRNVMCIIHMDIMQDGIHY